MNRQAVQQQVYRTTTVGQLIAALVECRDQTDVSHVFEHHQGGTRGFEIACQRLGISQADWDYANNEAGFYFLVGIVGEKLGLPRYDPAAEKARRETFTALMKSLEATNQGNEPTMEKAAKETKLLLDSLTDKLSRELPNRKLDVWINPFQEVTYVPGGETAYLTFGINDVPSAVRALREVYQNEGFERGVAAHITAEQKLLAAGYVRAEVELRKDELPIIGLIGKGELVSELHSDLERVGIRVSRLEVGNIPSAGFNIAQRASRMRRDGWRRSFFQGRVRNGRVGCIIFLMKLRLKRCGWQKLSSFAN
jgi:hypothetical protein